MEDSFRVRVDKAFGSLTSSSNASSPSSSLSSLWCLTDEEIERREWNRERDSPDDLEPKPFPSNGDGFLADQQKVLSQAKPSYIRTELEADIHDLNDQDDDDYADDDEKRRRGSSSRLSVRPDDHDDEEWDIRSSIGLDPTLDREEEEDEYDKVAVGREKAGDRLYMSDITDYGADINSYNELPDTITDVIRDPRANHMAAKLRLKEDAEAAANLDSLQVSDNPPIDTQDSTIVDGIGPKSILRRRENEMDSKSQKRVRFDPGCKHSCEDESKGAKNVAIETSSMEEVMVSEEASYLPRDSSGVPDYIRNPSKYTRYTFDSSTDIDEDSNEKAYMDFLNLLKATTTTSTAPPKSVAFIPKKRSSTVRNGNEFKQNQENDCKEFIQKSGLPIGIAAEDAQESEVCSMEEDAPETAANKSSSLRRPGRHYRSKASIDLEELID